MMRAVFISILVAGLCLLYPLQGWVERASPREAVSEETLYFSSGETVKKMSLGLHGLAANVYWIRTLQYFGKKIDQHGGIRAAANTRDIKMDLLAPLLKIITTLDPRHVPAYRFGAIFLPERDFPAAVELLERGVRENPNEWRLYQDLGFMYWQVGDYENASQWYERGGRVPDAPWWMRDLSGVMKIKGGTRETARAVYSSYLNSDDERIRAQAEYRLKQLQASDEMDALNRALARYKEQTGACPSDLRQLAPALRAMRFPVNQEFMPVDPSGFPYRLKAEECRVDLHHDSTIPR
jgi:tetratricopeptide (TPR) repeat protein